MTEKENNIPNEDENLISEVQSTKQEKDDTPKKRWYVVHTYSGHENKVKVNLEKRIEENRKRRKNLPRICSC